MRNETIYTYLQDGYFIFLRRVKNTLNGAPRFECWVGHPFNNALTENGKRFFITTYAGPDAAAKIAYNQIRGIKNV